MALDSRQEPVTDLCRIVGRSIQGLLESVVTEGLSGRIERFDQTIRKPVTTSFSWREICI